MLLARPGTISACQVLIQPRLLTKMKRGMAVRSMGIRNVTRMVKMNKKRLPTKLKRANAKPAIALTTPPTTTTVTPRMSVLIIDRSKLRAKRLR